jgi:hypothetical protein
MEDWHNITASVLIHRAHVHAPPKKPKISTLNLDWGG